MCSGYARAWFGKKKLSGNTGKLIPELPKVKGYPLCDSPELESRRRREKFASFESEHFGNSQRAHLSNWSKIPVLTFTPGINFAPGLALASRSPDPEHKSEYDLPKGGGINFCVRAPDFGFHVPIESQKLIPGES